MNMASGILGIIACPMLEDELIYSVKNDSEPKMVYVLDTKHCGNLKTKLNGEGVPYEVLSETDFDLGRVKINEDSFNIVIKMNDLGLHAEPKDLRVLVEKQIAEIQSDVDALGIYYGLCGNIGWDLSVWCKSMGYKPTEVFRDFEGHVCDDCIGVCVGGGPRYLDLVKKYTGMLYATPATASNWRDALGAGVAGDYKKIIKSMNSIDSLRELGINTPEEYMKWLLNVCGYKNILKIDSGLADMDEFDKNLEEMSNNLELKIKEAEPGWATLQPAEDIYAACKRNMRS